MTTLAVLELIVLIALAILVPALIWIIVMEVQYCRQLNKEPQIIDTEANRILDEFYREDL